MKENKEYENDVEYNRLYNKYQKALFNYLTVTKILDKAVEQFNRKRREYGLKDINIF